MEKFTFFNDVNGDRVSYAEDFARHLSTYFTNGIFNNGCLVSENNSMNVIVGVGSANINGYRYDNDSNKVLIIENADGVLSRIDNVVIRLDLTSRTITSQIIKGSFSNEPVAPDLVRTSTIYDLRIAKISIPAGTTTITQDLIEDTRFLNSDCGNVISAVETPNTEALYSQLYAKANKFIADSQEEFSVWFDSVQDLLDENVAGKLANSIKTIVDNGLKSYQTTLLSTSWVLNSTTNLYEYNITKEGITENTYINVNGDLMNRQKLSDVQVNSYNGYFILSTSELPTEDVDVTICYQLSNMTLTGGNENVGQN